MHLICSWALLACPPSLSTLLTLQVQVGDGFTDFYPPPAETRSIIGAGYSCPATLLVQVRAGCAAIACGNVHTCIPAESVDSLMCGPPAAYTVLASHAISAQHRTAACSCSLALAFSLLARLLAHQP